MSALDRYLPPLSERATRWVRFFAVVAVLFLLGWAALALRDVLTPIVAAFALAYMLNPVVTWLEKKRKISRTASCGVGIVLLILTSGVLIFAGSVQLVEFAGRVPGYFAEFRNWVDRSSAALQEKLGPQLWSNRDDAEGIKKLTASQPTSDSTTAPVVEIPPAKHAARETPEGLAKPSVVSSVTSVVPDYGVEIARSILANVTAMLSNLFYWLSLMVLLPMYTFYFLVHFNDMVEAIRRHIPEAYRPWIVDIASTIDRSIANFFRGRLLVCLCMGLCASLGWLIAGVPNSLVLGAAVGVLSLIPFMSVLVLPPALFLTYVSATQAGHPWAMPLMLVFAVYLAVQAIESFILSPIIESKASGLHPVTVIIALMIGNQVAGLLGMLLAIPIASTLKSLAVRYVLPEIRRLAGQPEPRPPEAERPYAVAAPAKEPAPPPQDAR